MQKMLMLIASVLSKGTGMTRELLLKYCEILFNGRILKVSNHEIKYTDLSREERDLLSKLFTEVTINDLIQTLKLKKIPHNTLITDPMLIQAVLEANPVSKRVMHQLMQWMSSCTSEVRQKLSSFLVCVMERSPGQNIAFGNLDGRDFVLNKRESLFEILPDLYHDKDYQFSLQVGSEFKTLEFVKKNPKLFKYVFAEAVRNMPDPKPEDEGPRRSHEFNADTDYTDEFPEIEKVTKPSPAPVEVAKPSPALVEVVEKPTVTGKDEELRVVLGSNLPDELKVKVVMQMLTSV